MELNFPNFSWGVTPLARSRYLTVPVVIPFTRGGKLFPVPTGPPPYFFWILPDKGGETLLGSASQILISLP